MPTCSGKWRRSLSQLRAVVGSDLLSLSNDKSNKIVYQQNLTFIHCREHANNLINWLDGQGV